MRSLSYKEGQKLLRRIDWYLVPLMMLIYTLRVRLDSDEWDHHAYQSGYGRECGQLVSKVTTHVFS